MSKILILLFFLSVCFIIIFAALSYKKGKRDEEKADKLFSSEKTGNLGLELNSKNKEKGK